MVETAHSAAFSDRSSRCGDVLFPIRCLPQIRGSTTSPRVLATAKNPPARATDHRSTRRRVVCCGNRRRKRRKVSDPLVGVSGEEIRCPSENQKKQKTKRFPATWAGANDGLYSSASCANPVSVRIGPGVIWRPFAVGSSVAGTYRPTNRSDLGERDPSAASASIAAIKRLSGGRPGGDITASSSPASVRWGWLELRAAM